MRVCKWGNSLAIRLPISVVEAMKIKAGDEVQIITSAERKTIQLDKKPDLDALIEKLKTYRKFRPANYAFDRDDANAR